MQHQPWEGQGYISWPLKGMNPFTHTLIPLMFPEDLQCTRHRAGGEGDGAEQKRAEPSARSHGLYDLLLYWCA